jgi:hypothetical protein
MRPLSAPLSDPQIEDPELKAIWRDLPGPSSIHLREAVFQHMLSATPHELHLHQTARQAAAALLSAEGESISQDDITDFVIERTLHLPPSATNKVASDLSRQLRYGSHLPDFRRWVEGKRPRSTLLMTCEEFRVNPDHIDDICGVLEMADPETWLSYARSLARRDALHWLVHALSQQHAFSDDESAGYILFSLLERYDIALAHLQRDLDETRQKHKLGYLPPLKYDESRQLLMDTLPDNWFESWPDARDSSRRRYTVGGPLRAGVDALIMPPPTWPTGHSSELAPHLLPDRGDTPNLLMRPDDLAFFERLKAVTDRLATWMKGSDLDLPGLTPPLKSPPKRKAKKLRPTPAKPAPSSPPAPPRAVTPPPAPKPRPTPKPPAVAPQSSGPRRCRLRNVDEENFNTGRVVCGYVFTYMTAIRAGFKYVDDENYQRGLWSDIPDSERAALQEEHGQDAVILIATDSAPTDAAPFFVIATDKVVDVS